MQEEKKPKRKYTRRPKVEPLAVYAVMVKVTRGRKVETIYAESTRVENGCLVIVSMDGPQPLVEKTRYIPLQSAEIEVCERPKPYFRMPTTASTYQASRDQMLYTEGSGQIATLSSGPQISPGPLEIARQRAAMAPTQPRHTAPLVERNADGVAVVTAGFGDERPT